MYKPQLCKLESRPFNLSGWIWERKLDGQRIISYVNKDCDYQLISRSMKDKTFQFPDLKFNVSSDCVLDGELVSATGLSFQDFTQRRANRIYSIESISDELQPMYILFDILELNHKSLLDVSLSERKVLLRDTVYPSDTISVITSTTDGIALFSEAESKGWEGIVGKDLSDMYEENKRRWIKVKVWQQDKFMAVGYSVGTGKRLGKIGAIELQDENGRSVGSVGTGFSDEELSMLQSSFVEVERDLNFVSIEPVVVNIKYLEITNDGKLRFPVWLGKEELCQKSTNVH